MTKAKAPVPQIDQTPERPLAEEPLDRRVVAPESSQPSDGAGEGPGRPDAPDAGTQAADATPSDARPTGETRVPAGTRSPMEWLRATFPGHEHAFLGGLCGLLVAVLVFVLGFWETLFVSLLVVVGVALGQYVDGDPKIIRALRRLLAEGRGNN